MASTTISMSLGRFSTPSRRLTWLITGCSSGLGLSLARYVQSQGHYVIATSRNPSKTPELVQEIERDNRSKGRWMQLDVTDPNSSQIIDKIEESNETHVDVLVNNAGSSIHNVAEAFTEDEVRQQMELLYFGPFRLTRAVVPGMRRRGFGIVVTISTGASLEGRETMGLYAAGKSAFDALIKVLAKEVAAFNIRTLTVFLGSFNTNMPTSVATGSAAMPHQYQESTASHILQAMKAQQGTVKALGDKDKAASRIFDVIVGRGTGAGQEGQLFLPLGSEMPARIRLVRDRLDQCLATFEETCNSVGIDQE